MAYDAMNEGDDVVWDGNGFGRNKDFVSGCATPRERQTHK